MTMLQGRPVYLVAASVLNAAGSEAGDLHGAVPQPRPLPFAAERAAHAVAAPRLPADLFDRKIQRSVEPQGLRLLHCAARLAPALRELRLPAQRVGLTAAIPEVDAPSPCWDAVEAIEREPDRLLAQLLANTPPLHALTLLNSSVMAYVAEALDCRGVMAGYCAQVGAGFDALIEAVAEIAEGRADAALSVSCSPNLTPALFLRDEPGQDVLYGEGAAALLLAAQPPLEGLEVRVAGYGRGFSADPQRRPAVLQQAVHQALQAERLTPRDIDWLGGSVPDLAASEPFAACAVLRDTREVTGELGASGLATEIAALIGDPRHEREPRLRHVLLPSVSRAGHCDAMLLAITWKEKA